MSFPVDQAKVEEIKEKLIQRDQFIRESWVKAMEARVVKEQLAICQLHEGVNHYQNCSWLARKCIDMLKENRVQGYKIIDI